MGERPKPVTIIAWLFIVSGTLSFFSSLSFFNSPLFATQMAENPLPIPAQYAMMFIGTGLSIICGIGLLKRQGWVRLLYAVGGGAILLVSAFTSPMKIVLIPSGIFFLTIIFFLYRPAANQYFASKE